MLGIRQLPSQISAEFYRPFLAANFDVNLQAEGFRNNGGINIQIEVSYRQAFRAVWSKTGTSLPPKIHFSSQHTLTRG